jgi:hypothetical protein
MVTTDRKMQKWSQPIGRCPRTACIPVGGPAPGGAGLLPAISRRRISRNIRKCPERRPASARASLRSGIYRGELDPVFDAKLPTIMRCASAIDLFEQYARNGGPPTQGMPARRYGCDEAGGAGGATPRRSVPAMRAPTRRGEHPRAPRPHQTGQLSRRARMPSLSDDIVAMTADGS